MVFTFFKWRGYPRHEVEIGGGSNVSSGAASSLIGLPAIVGNKPYTLTATARQGAEVKFATRVDYEDLIRAEPSLCFKLLGVPCSRGPGCTEALLVDLRSRFIHMQ